MKSKGYVMTVTIIFVFMSSIIFQIQSLSTAQLFTQQDIETNQTELIIPRITDSNVIIDGLINQDEYGTSFSETRSGINVYWEHDGVDFTIGLVSPGTGWLSFGIGSNMKDSNMIIGGLNGSTSFCFDVFGLSGHEHENDTEHGGEYNVLDYAVTETATTVLEVQIPMDSGDILDPVLEEGSESPFFFAYHPNNDSIAADHDPFQRSDIIFAMVEEEALDLDEFDKSIPLVQESLVVVDGDITENEYPSSFTDLITGMSVYWEHNLVEFRIALIAPGTGWVALGIGPNMLESTMYMGGVENGDTYCADLDGLVDWFHEEDGTNDIIDCVATETDDETTLEFVIPMNTTDSLDTVLEVQKVYEMFLGYHESSDDRTQKHTAYSEVFTVLVMPEATAIETFMVFQSDTVVDFNETINFEIELSDENGSLADVPVVFFMDSQFGEIIITQTYTDVTGKANASYSNPYLLHEHTFGARSLEMVIVESGEVFSLKSSEARQEIMFVEKIEHDERAENLRFTRIGLLVAFWIVGLVIWGGFSYVFYQMYQIFKGRNEEFDENVSSMTDVNLDGDDVE
ncbi:MAG: DOMON domain-containing protein [Candidatus Kariarchaeaceae archaeon]|jgi:hypothetical protein